MALAKLLLACAIVAVLSVSDSANVLDLLNPIVLLNNYIFSSSREAYHLKLDEPNGSHRDEIGMLLNPGTDKEEFVVMGAYTVYDDKTDTETTTMYTADKDGYKSHFVLRNLKLNNCVLKSCTG